MTQPNDIAIAIMTRNRQPQYIHGTVESLLASGGIVRELAGFYMAVDETDTAYLSGINMRERMTIVPLTNTEAEAVGGMILHQRACHNYHRALTLPPGHAAGLLVCEDDLVFCPGFLEKLLQTLNEMEAAGLKDFMLACYASYDFDSDRSLKRGTFYSSYPAHWFYGTQCMFYTRSEIPAVAGTILKHGVLRYENAYDMLIKHHAMYRNNLYATRRSLVQHVGIVSTGLGKNHHTSPTFHLPWPE